MGVKVNGARTFLHALYTACRMSRIPGFQAGLSRILGTTNYNAVNAVWVPLCEVIDELVGLDIWFNQKDLVDDDSTGEDTPLGG